MKKLKRKKAFIIVLVVGLILGIGSVVLAATGSTAINNRLATTNDFGNTGVWK